MKVKELIQQLKQEDPERVVLVSRDEEGNGFLELRELGTSAGTNGGYEWEIGLEELTDELKKQGYSDEDVMDGVPVLVLWP
jgi:hypothetical protein